MSNSLFGLFLSGDGSCWVSPPPYPNTLGTQRPSCCLNFLVTNAYLSWFLNSAIDMSCTSEWDIPLVLFVEFVQCFYTGINVLCGVGILSTPYAIKQGGWVGLVILYLFAVLAWYTGVLLRRCLDSKEGLETYPDIGHAAFGTTGRILISVWHHSDYK